MPEPHVFALFMGAALVLLIAPGPAVLYIVGRSVDQGVGAGVVAALGLVTGGAVHVLAAVLGVSALLAASPAALSALLWAGAAYLAWLGWQAIRSGAASEAQDPIPPRTRLELYRQGVWVSLLNPKAILFFLAFLPQFVRPDGADARLQLLALGATFLALALCTDTMWALVAGRAGEWLRGHGRGRLRRWFSATVYFALSLAAVWSRG